MNEIGCCDLEFIKFSVASPRGYICTVAARVQPDSPKSVLDEHSKARFLVQRAGVG